MKIFRNELGLRKVGLDGSVPSQLWPRVPPTLESGDSGAGSFFFFKDSGSLKSNKITFLAGGTD